MGPERRVAQLVSNDDPLWGLLKEVEQGDVRKAGVAIASVVAQSWGQPVPQAVLATDVGSDGDVFSNSAWYEHLLALAARGQLEPELIGRCWETMLSRADRRSQGSHYTPPGVAAEVVQIAVDAFLANGRDEDAAGVPRPIRVWDPSCGGGAFLLAALHLLEERTGADRSDLVANCFATDIDGFALTMCDAALEIWSGGRTRPHRMSRDALLVEDEDYAAHGWPQSFEIVVGNPPFLGQLTSDTARTGERSQRLREKFNSVSRAYLDEAGLFVAMASQRVADGGVVGLIVPSSLLGAADAVELRRTVRTTHDLSALWIDPVQSFAAAVDVVAIILTRREGPDPIEGGTTTVWRDSVKTNVATPTAQTWAPLLASADAVPAMSLSSTHGVVGDRARITAGFRQHYYGIVDAVAEGASVAAAPALITAGSIDPLMSNWGTRETKFGRRRWKAPVLQLDQIADDAVRDWFVERCRPKLLLASQTSVVEVLVDPDGRLVPSVPVLVVEPADADDLWLLAAMASSPAASAWLYLRAAGTGLSRTAIRVRASEVASLPLPSDHDAWAKGAEYAKTAQEVGAAGDHEGYLAALRKLGKAMDEAYCVSDSVGRWWWNRVGKGSRGHKQAY